MSVVADQVRAEERAAREQHRHMERMRREAERAREREAAEERRMGRARHKIELTTAERTARDRCREYSRALAAAHRRPGRPWDELDRELDRAYRSAQAACDRLRGYRVQYGVGCWS